MPGAASSASPPSCCRTCLHCSNGSDGRLARRPRSPSARGRARSPDSGLRWPSPRALPPASASRSLAATSLNAWLEADRRRWPPCRGRVPARRTCSREDRPRRTSSTATICRTPRPWSWRPVSWPNAFGLTDARRPRGAIAIAPLAAARLATDPAGDDLRTLEPIYLRAPRGVPAESGERVKWL